MESDENTLQGLKWTPKSIESVKYGLGSLQRPIFGRTKIFNFCDAGPVTTENCHFWGTRSHPQYEISS